MTETFFADAPYRRLDDPLDGYKNILGWADRLDEIDGWRAPFEGLN